MYDAYHLQLLDAWIKGQMEKTNTFAEFGERVEGYDQPVLNEREIRAAAGILFVPMLIALMRILLKDDFLMIKYYIILFFFDLLIRVFISPRFSPSLIIGRLAVSRQAPEYVAAAQKKFAWKIGIALSGLMFFLIVILNSYSIFTGLSCLLCLGFLFFESAFGICLGCVFYGWFYRQKVQYCAGEICEIKEKHDIQKISGRQIFVLFCFLAFVFLISIFFKDYLAAQPENLWKIVGWRGGFKMVG